MTTTNTTPRPSRTVWTITPEGQRGCYRVYRYGRALGYLELHESGYADWTFVGLFGLRPPGAAVRARLLREVRAMEVTR